MGVFFFQWDHLNAKMILSSKRNAFRLYEISWFTWQPIMQLKK